VSESLGDEIKFLVKTPRARNLRAFSWNKILPNIPKFTTIEIEETFIMTWDMVRDQIWEEA